MFGDFGGAADEEIREPAAAKAEALIPQLAAGSMRPKLEAALQALASGVTSIRIGEGGTSLVAA